MSDEPHVSVEAGIGGVPADNHRGTCPGLRVRPAVWRGGAAVVAFILAFAVAPTLSPFYLSSASQMAAYAIVAMGASLIIQHAQLPSLGHGAFFGVASYAVGLLTVHNIASTLPALLLALLITGAAAAVIGVVALRARAAYFMMITLAIGQLLSGVASSLTDITGGDNGLTGLPSATIGGVDLADPTQFYYTCLVVLVGVAALVVLMVASPYGHALRALKHDDRRARSLGVAPLRVKLVAFVISGVITGLGGALYTLNVAYTEPNVLSVNNSGAIFLMVVLFSRLGVLGPIIGAILVEFITLVIGGYTTHVQLILGIVSALIALFFMRSDTRTAGYAPRQRGSARRERWANG